MSWEEYTTAPRHYLALFRQRVHRDVVSGLLGGYQVTLLVPEATFKAFSEGTWVGTRITRIRKSPRLSRASGSTVGIVPEAHEEVPSSMRDELRCIYACMHVVVAESSNKGLSLV